MKALFAFSLAGTLLAQPLVAQEQDAPPSLMERGGQMFLEGLRDEMAPALDDMAGLLEQAGPAMRDFLTQMGPKLRDVVEQVQDWSVYEAPEVLENGDIIIRRKPDLPPEAEEPQGPSALDMPQIDL